MITGTVRFAAGRRVAGGSHLGRHAFPNALATDLSLTLSQSLQTHFRTTATIGIRIQKRDLIFLPLASPRLLELLLLLLLLLLLCCINKKRANCATGFTAPRDNARESEPRDHCIIDRFRGKAPLLPGKRRGRLPHFFVTCG